VHVLPDVLDRVQFWRARRQEDQGEFPGTFQLFGGVPPGAVEEKNGMAPPSYGAADLVEMGLHGFGVGVWHG